MPWRKIIGLRNLLAHGYWVIDAEELWDVAKHKIAAFVVHVHALVLDGVFARDGQGRLRFHAAPGLDSADVADVLAAVTPGVHRLLRRRGCDSSEEATAEDAFAAATPVLAGLAAASVQGQLALTDTPCARPQRLGAATARQDSPPPAECHAQWEGFDLHAAVRLPAGHRARLERVCRYALRPPAAGTGSAWRTTGRSCFICDIRGPTVRRTSRSRPRRSWNGWPCWCHGLLLINSRTIGPVGVDLNVGATWRSGDGSQAPRRATLWTVAAGIPVSGALGWALACFGYPGTGGGAGSPPIVALLTGPRWVLRLELALDSSRASAGSFLADAASSLFRLVGGAKSDNGGRRPLPRVARAKPSRLEGARYHSGTHSIGGLMTRSVWWLVSLLVVTLGQGARTRSVAPQPDWVQRAPASHAMGAWTPRHAASGGVPSCSSALHDTYFVVAPDGHRFPTWHPPVVTDPTTGADCAFGHEHGRDPRGSALWQTRQVQRAFYFDANANGRMDADEEAWAGLPFGYVNARADEWFEAQGIATMRHEDHVGHKVEWANGEPDIASR